MKKITTAALLLIVLQYAFAQDSPSVPADSTFTIIDTYTTRSLSEVTISSYHINDSLLKAPAAISVLYAGQIQRNNNTDISQIMNTLPGVQMQSGAINTNRISIRGIGARTTYGTNKIRAFYGSIPLTTGDSETTIEDIDMEVIGKMEVIKGPLSSVYGAGLGGAILIEPKHTADGKTIASSSTTVGSFGLVKNTFNFGSDFKTGSVNINYHKLQSDGWRDNSSYYREGVTLAGDLLRKAESRLTYFGNYTYMKAYIPSSVTKESFENNPKAAAPTWAASKGYEQYHSYMGGLAYDWRVATGIKNSTSVFITAKDNYEPRPFDILTQSSTGYGGRTQFSGNFKLGILKTEFIAGAEYFRDGYDGGTFENLYEQNNGNGTLEGNRLTGDEQHRDFVNAFTQLRFLISKHFEAQAGLNYNKTNFDLNTTFPAEAVSSGKHSYDGIFSPQASLLYKPDNGKTVYASISRGFSLPAIEETLTENGTINPNIKPESGYNVEVGAKFNLLNHHLYADVALYRMLINNLLVAQRVGDDQYIGINAGETLHQGIEASARYVAEFGEGWDIIPYTAVSIGDYTFREFLNNDIDYSGNKLTGVPSTKINGGITFNTPLGVYLSADYYYNSGIPMNDANSAYSDSYNLLNAKIGWTHTTKFGLGIQLAAGINNVANTHYASMVLVNATGASPRYYYPGLPVNYFGNVGVSYTF